MKVEGTSFSKFKYNLPQINKLFPHLIIAFKIIGLGRKIKIIILKRHTQKKEANKILSTYKEMKDIVI